MSRSKTATDADNASTTRRSCGNSTPATFLDVYAKLFVNRVTPVLRAAADGSWFSQRTKLTRGLLRNALQGETSLGLYSVSETGSSKWACLETDRQEESIKLLQILDHLPTKGHVLLEASRRGYHLWMFFSPPVPWEQARQYGLSLAGKAGLASEVFPKGAGLNGVRAVLTPHPNTRIIYPLLDPATREACEDQQAVVERVVPLPASEVATLFVAQPAEREFERRMPIPFPHLSRTDEHRFLVEELNRYTDLRYVGPERLIGRCPFHSPDRHPSLGVIKGYWRCWTCGISGGLNAFKKQARERGLVPRR